MKWYNYLYVGQNVKENQADVIQKIKDGKVQFDKYVLALPFNDSDTLDIYPSNVLIQKHYINSGLIIVGIANGRDEAMQLMQTMIMDCYNETGEINLRGFIISRGVSD